MNAYLVKMIFQIVCGSGDHRPQFDEQLRLIFADDEKMAVQMAKLQGGAECNVSELVQWKFIAVTDVYLFSKDLDGAALFSTITETEWGEAYIVAQLQKEKALIRAIHC